MDRKKLAAAATALTLIGGGSAVAADQQIDPYTEKAATYEVQIEGETVEIAKDRPEVKLNRWGGEESLTVKKSGDYGEAKRGWFSRQQKWQKGIESVIVEPLKNEGENIANADTQGEEGFKIDILLDEKPDTNVFTLELEGWEDLNFFYQPELTPEDIAAGDTRPDNVVGSYAVFHKSKRNHFEGSTNYGTGKLYHIYRPKVLDSEGNDVWGQLGYESGILSVTVPQEFLDNAVYPVRVDPTFGYTTAGASGWTMGTGEVKGTQFNSLAASGAITKFTVHDNGSGGTVAALGAAIYSDSSSLPNAVLAQDSGNISPSSSGWWDINVSYTFSSNTKYWLAVFNSGSPAFRHSYDTGGPSNKTIIDSSNTFETWPEPATADISQNRIYSIYATYTCDEGGSVNTCAFVTPGYHTWTAPAGVTRVDVAAWGAGGGGGIISASGGGGGGGGAFASSTITVTPGQTYTIFVGAGGASDTSGRAGTSSFATTTVAAQGGSGTIDATAGAAGLAASSIGTRRFDGGAGGTGNTTGDVGGGGGGAGGFDGAGVAGTTASSSQGGPGGAGNNGLGGAGGAGGNGAAGGHGTSSHLGGGGGGGGDDTFSGGTCGAPGAGSGGGEVTGGGAGCDGQVVVTYTTSNPGTFNLIANTASSSAGAITTNSIDTTGADLIVIGLAADDGYNTTPTDSKSNTWTQATSYTQGNVRVRLWYTTPSSVGSGHTFSFSGSPLGTMFVAAFSGANQSSPYDQQNGANAFATSLATGSITPTEDNELIIGLYGINSTGVPMSVDNGLIEINEVDFVSSNYYGGMMAYKVQTTAAAINPTFTRTNSNGQAATVVSFKRAADAPAGSTPSQSVIFFE